LSACLDDTQLADLLAGRLSSTQPRGHLDACASCRERLASAIAALDPEAALALDARLPAIAGLALVATLPTSELETQPMEHVPGLVRGADIPLPRGTLIDRYVVLDRVGSGAMGAVYAAYDPELDRKVALKLLRTDIERHGVAAAELRARLLREGQAMARLSHPAVITIFDVGAFGDEIFIAMEFVDGSTLRDWMHPRRPWRDVLALALRAGAGLQAAHDAGIVHRDFKPDNVLVGAAGVEAELRVRVTDFGLAVAPQATLDMPASPGASGSLSGRISPIVTVAGSVLGSPAYMAPEQMDGRAGPRADQFSFCVTLYEALYGERPFAGTTIAALADAIRHHRIQPPPAGAQVPRWLRGVLARGLSTDAEQRYPSMTALLAALLANPARRLRRVALAALGVAALVAVGLGWHTVHEARALECSGGERTLRGTWDPAREAQVAHAFLATGTSYAPVSLAGTRRLLDDYTGAWTTMHRAACEATHVRREQSAALLDLRMLCLDEHRKQLRALVDVLAAADAQTVEHAATAARDLAPIDECADVRGLDASAPPPRDPVQAARVAALARIADEAHALDGTGKYDRALAMVQHALPDARAIGYAPRTAKLAYLAGVISLRTGKIDEGITLLHESAREAERARSDALLADAWTVMIFATGIIQGHSEEALRWAGYAHVAHDRASGGDVGLATILDYEGQVLARSGHAAEGLIAMRRAVAINEQQFGKDDLLTLRAESNMAVVMADQGRFEEARDISKHVMEVHDKLLGPTHPDTLLALENYGALMVTLDRGGEVRALLERGLAAIRQQVGPRTPLAASAELNLAEALAEADRYPEAVALNTDALAILEPLVGGPHPFIAEGLTNLGIDALGVGKPDDAVAPLERALTVHEALKSTPVDAAITRFALARALIDRNPARARQLAEVARAAYADAGAQFGGYLLVRARQVADWLAAHAT